MVLSLLLEKHLNLTCSLNEYTLSVWGWMGEEKNEWKLCEIRQFQFTGL